jgi:hypothetical protein
MQPLTIKQQDDKIPNVSFDNTTGRMDISGMSYIEHARSFYDPLIDWINEYSKSPMAKTELNIKLKYFNTSSAKCLLDLMERLNKLTIDGNDLSINWFFQEGDEDMQDAIVTFSELIGFEINMIAIDQY